MSRFLSHVQGYMRWYLLLSLVFISMTLWFVVFYEDRNDELVFAVLDVGQGDALLIESASGIQVLIDGGPHRALMKEISQMLPFYDRHIDMLVITNPDKDHYEGFIALLDRYTVDVVVEPGTSNSSEVYAILQQKIKEKGIPRIIARSGQRISLGGDAYVDILFPDRDVSGLSSNDGSIVMRLVYGNTSAMLQGDSTERIEQYLLTTFGNRLDSDILKVGHHGSRTSSDDGYVVAVSPQWAVISSGKDNDYGHPHKETLDTLLKVEVPTYSTCDNGRLVFKSDGQRFILMNENLKPASVGCK